MTPGATALPRTPRGPSSTASVLVSCATPALVVAYAPKPAAGRSTTADEMVTMAARAAAALARAPPPPEPDAAAQPLDTDSVRDVGLRRVAVAAGRRGRRPGRRRVNVRAHDGRSGRRQVNRCAPADPAAGPGDDGHQAADVA